MGEQLKPCPFCGSTNVNNGGPRGIICCVRCDDCEATGPTCTEREYSSSTWDERPIEKALQSRCDRYEAALRKIAGPLYSGNATISGVREIAKEALADRGTE